MDRLVGLCDDVNRKGNKAAITIESKACKGGGLRAGNTAITCSDEEWNEQDSIQGRVDQGVKAVERSCGAGYEKPRHPNISLSSSILGYPS